MTTNSDYAGCRDVNQSIISRMDLIYDIEAPDLATMVKRVMNVTGCTDEQETTKMAMVVRDIAERCPADDDHRRQLRYAGAEGVGALNDDHERSLRVSSVYRQSPPRQQTRRTVRI